MAAPTLETVIATLRAFSKQAGATRAVALLDRRGGRAVLVEGAPGESFAVDDGEDQTLVPEEATADVAPLALPAVKRLPPMQVDALRGEVVAPIGGVAFLAAAVHDLARSLGGRSVLTVEFATTDPEAPLVIAARSGEPIELALGAEQFTMPADWP